MENMQKQQILLDVLYLEDVSNIMKVRIMDTFPDYMPTKGYGYISVDNPQKAEAILKEHVGEYEWNYYPTEKNHPDDSYFKLIHDHEHSHSIHYGKFEIENLQEFFIKLYNANIRIYSYSFEESSL